MSWLFSQALAAAFSRDTSWAGGPCAQLSVMPTAQPFWRNDKPMPFSRFSRFGLTSQPLTVDHGEELLMWFRAGFRVRTSALQDPAPASTESAADFGFTWRESFAKYDRATRSWRTRQFSLLGDLAEFSETWPRWGAMRDGECSERPMSERPIFARESGLLPTPCAIDSGSFFNQSDSDGAQLRPTLGAMARFNLWPTPLANDAQKRGDFDMNNPRNGLAAAVRRWPTPTAGGGGQTLPFGTTPTGQMPDGQKRTVSLEQSVTQVERQLWPTPTVKVNYNRKGVSPTSGNGLATAVRQFPTPTVAMRKGSSEGALTRKSGRSRARDRLDYAIEQDASCGRLNPAWVEWLMGWPIGWTALQPLAMDKFREWLRQHGDY